MLQTYKEPSFSLFNRNKGSSRAQEYVDPLKIDKSIDSKKKMIMSSPGTPLIEKQKIMERKQTPNQFKFEQKVQKWGIDQELISSINLKKLISNEKPKKITLNNSSNFQSPSKPECIFSLEEPTRKRNCNLHTPLSKSSFLSPLTSPQKPKNPTPRTSTTQANRPPSFHPYYSQGLIKSLSPPSPTSPSFAHFIHCLSALKYFRLKSINPLIYPDACVKNGKIEIRAAEGGECESRRLNVVFDLDETLVVAIPEKTLGSDLIVPIRTQDGKVQRLGVYFRPHLIETLTELNKVCNIYILTASQKEYADAILDKIEKLASPIFKGRYYKNSCTKLPNGRYIKDLAVLSLPLSRSVLVDNCPFAFGKHLLNCVPILPFTGNKADDQLPSLQAYLTTLAGDGCDVREGVQRQFRWIDMHLGGDWKELSRVFLRSK